MSSIKGRIRKILPWQVAYYYDFTVKNHIPRLFKKDYSDYIFWDNILGRHIPHAYLADKYAVRKYVEDKGLGFLLTKLYGVWDNPADIDFASLPNGFAIKCNHGCDMNIICFDKSKLDIDATRQQLGVWLKQEYEFVYEQQYRHIKPRIICEELIPNNRDGNFPPDYKIHCANGKPVFIQACFDRSETDEGRRVLYSPEWKNLHYVKQDEYYTEKELEAPRHLKEMLEYASILSTGLKYARIDLYDSDERVYFGEVTLTPFGGWLPYFTQEALDVMGKAIREGKKK